MIRSFNVTDDISVGSITLGLNISHNYRGAIGGYLQAPDSSFIQFLTVNGGDTNDNYDVLFQDGGNTINDGNNDNVSSPFYDRTANPSQALASFTGKSALGTWRLLLCDAGSGLQGTYNRSRLTISPPDISGSAFDDVNRDNIKGGNEAVLANIGVTAYLDDGDGVFEPGAGDTSVATVLTGTSGAYAFNGLSNGSYWIDIDETDSDLAGRSYGGSAATGTADPRLVTFSGSAITNIDFPFYQDLQFLCDPGDPDGQLAFVEGAQLEPDSPVSGLNLNAVYRFANVFPGVDALVEISSFNGGATLLALDNDSTGVASAFQPTLGGVSGATSSVDFNITFVTSGTKTPIAFDFKAAGVDIDGDGSSVREFIELTNLSSYTNGSSLNAIAITNGTRFESNTIAFQPGVSATATQTLAIAQYNSVSQFRYRIGAIDEGASSAIQRLNSLYFGCTSGPATTSNPDVLLVKRITAINGNRTENVNDSTALNTFVEDGVSNSSDDHSNWPTDYLLGEISAGFVKPGDEIEYTIYFLNAGNSDAADVRICDLIQPNQSFVLDAYGAGTVVDGTGSDLQLQLGTSSAIDLTTADDANDRTQLIAGGATVPADRDCNLKGTNADGVVVIDLTGAGGTGEPSLTALPGSTGAGVPNDSYGLVRFTTKVDE